MKEKLLELRNNAYTPITNFKVSAILVTKDGKEIPGVNVEDASTRAGTCAERNAIYAAIAQGYKPGDFKEINILTSGNRISAPCFVCRQMMTEVFDNDFIVRCFNNNGDFKEYTLKELCPVPFNKEDLK